MKSKDLGTVIGEFIKSNQRSVLIDGPWGCGKTYQIKEYISKSKNEKPSIYYLSLFGKESIDEINTELYRIIHPKLFKTKQIATFGLNLISKAISPISITGNASGIADALGFAINDLSDKNISNNNIIVFDDLERVDAKLTYISLLGYINSLFLSQTRIICLCSSGNIDTEKSDDFHDFKEKVFDRMHVIDESDEEIISGYFSDHNIKNLSAINCEFENNLRQAQKTAFFYAEITKYAKDKNYNLSDKITDIQLIRSCNQTIRICFSQHDKPIFNTTNNSDEETKSYLYNRDVDAVGENIANGLHQLLRAKKSSIIDPTLQTYSENIVKSLIDIFLFKNFTLFDQTFKPKDEVIAKEDILDNELYFLSDEKKKKYVYEFLNRLYGKVITFDKTNIQRFADILRYTNHEFTQEDRTRIIDIMFEQSTEESSGIMDVGSSILSTIHHVSGMKDASVFQPWANDIDLKRKSSLTKANIDKLKTSFETKRFTGMDLFVDNLDSKIDTRENEEIKNYIVNNNFLLPNLSGDMSHADWGYAHEMARYSKKIGKQQEFINNAINICIKKSTNESLIDRFEALIFYNIDSKFDFREKLKKTVEEQEK